MNINKVLLINLPNEGQCSDFYVAKYASGSFLAYPPLGLLYLATEIKKYYPVEVLDVVTLNYSINQVIEEIIKKSPTVLGISCPTLRLYSMYKIVQEVKKIKPDITIVVGGPHT